MLHKIATILKSTKGEIAINFVTVFFVMIVLLLTVFATTFISSYITYNRLVTEIEQNLNDSAAKTEKSFLFLSENDKGNYVVDENTLEQMQEAFETEFMRNLQPETDDWTITDADLKMYQSTEDGFSILHQFTCHIKVKVVLFNKSVSAFEKDIALNGRHRFAEVSIQEVDDLGSASQDTGTDDATESDSGEDIEPFVPDKED